MTHSEFFHTFVAVLAPTSSKGAMYPVPQRSPNLPKLHVPSGPAERLFPWLANLQLKPRLPRLIFVYRERALRPPLIPLYLNST